MTKSKDVAVSENQLPAGMMADMEADSQEHQQEFGRDQLIIPRIGILQDLSPQIKERNVAFVPGAKVGDIFNNVTNMTPDGIGKWVGQMKNNAGEMVQVECIETPEWIGMAHGKGWGPMPVAISFPSTKSKAARKINTAIDLTVEKNSAGKEFRPPAFYHKFTLKTAMETRGDDEWFGWGVTHDGYADAPDVAKAKELKIAFDKGDAEVDAEGASQS